MGLRRVIFRSERHRDHKGGKEEFSGVSIDIDCKPAKREKVRRNEVSEKTQSHQMLQAYGNSEVAPLSPATPSWLPEHIRNASKIRRWFLVLPICLYIDGHVSLLNS